MTTEQITEQEMNRRGEMIASTLGLRRIKNDPVRYATQWGTKSPIGLYLTVKRIIEEGE